MLVRKLVGLAALAGALSVVGNAAFTQANYPSAPIRVIIPLAPGGAIDVMVRALGRAFEQRNPAMASWSRAAPVPTPSSPPMPARRRRLTARRSACSRAARCRSTRRSTRTCPTTRSRISSRSPISLFAHQVLILNKNVPVTDFKELVAYSKQNPDKLNFGSFGVGGDTHLVVEWLKHETGAKMTHIPYKGCVRCDAGVQDRRHPDHLPYHRQSRYRAADQRRRGQGAAGARDRAAILSFPTCRRSPRADCRRDQSAFETWFGMFAPKGTPTEIVRKLNAEFSAIVKNAGLRRAVPDFQRIRAGRRQQRGICEVHCGGSEEGQAARRHLRREAGAMSADHRFNRD